MKLDDRLSGGQILVRLFVHLVARYIYLGDNFVQRSVRCAAFPYFFMYTGIDGYASRCIRLGALYTERLGGGRSAICCCFLGAWIPPDAEDSRSGTRPRVGFRDLGGNSRRFSSSFSDCLMRMVVEMQEITGKSRFLERLIFHFECG